MALRSADLAHSVDRRSRTDRAWRQWDHLREERRRTEIEIRGHAPVADLYE
jgi:hypothetical protein